MRNGSANVGAGGTPAPQSSKLPNLFLYGPLGRSGFKCDGTSKSNERFIGEEFVFDRRAAGLRMDFMHLKPGYRRSLPFIHD
jgi:hypothetical protein